MAFNFMQFAGGFADVIVDKVKAEEAQARDDESWDRRFNKQQDAIDKRTRGQTRRAADEKAQLLAEKLTVLYGEKASTEMMKKGYGFGSTYADIGQKHFDAGKDPKSYLNTELFPILKADGSNREEVDNAAQRFAAGTNGTASLINRDALFKGLKKPVDMKVLNNFNDQYAYYSSEAFMRLDIKNDKYNPEEAAKYQNAADFALAEIKKEAERNPDIDNPYGDVSITTYQANARRTARESLEFTLGIEDQIDNRIYGDESRLQVSELIASDDIKNFNTRKDGTIISDQFDRAQEFMRDTAKQELRTVASKTFYAGKDGVDPQAPKNSDGTLNKGLLNNFKVTKNEETGMFNVLNAKELTEARDNQNLSVGDVVIATDPKTNGPRLMIYTGIGLSGFLMAGELDDEALKYN